MKQSVSMAAALMFVLGVVACDRVAAQSPVPPPEPDGYRMDAYRAPTPATLKGATVVDTPRAYALWSAKAAIFVDVLPHPPKPAGLPANAVWRETPRENIPGSIWLPDTGYGVLAEQTGHYLETGLRRASDGDVARPLVFYCLKNCWMSWNVAKRAQTLGYRNVYWYPDGADGWAAAGHPLAVANPEPRN